MEIGQAFAISNGRNLNLLRKVHKEYHNLIITESILQITLIHSHLHIPRALPQSK